MSRPPYKTLSAPSGPSLLKEKKSKFLGYGFPAPSLEAVEAQLAALSKEHPSATHLCYAYRIGPEPALVRMNDDGEPAYTAGAPIMGKIESLRLADVLVCVVRYYGGIKLGVGGLIQAYRGAAALALEGAALLEVVPEVLLTLQFDYPKLDVVMRFMAQNQLHLRRQHMELDCTLALAVPAADLDRIREGLRSLGSITIDVQGGS